MQMCKGWECPCSKPIKLISEHLNLFSLLLGNIKQFPLMGNLLDLLAWVSIAIVHGVGLERHDLLTLVNIVLQLAGLRLQLLALHPLLTDFSLQLLLGLVDCLDTLVGILFQLFYLVLKTLLVLLVLLLVLALNDFLSLLGHSVQLDVLSSLLKIGDFEIESLFDVSNSLEISLELRNLVHQLDFFVTLVLDFMILHLDHVFRNKDGVLVVGGNWELRNFNPSLLEINDCLEVEPNLLNSLSGLLLCNSLRLILFINIGVLGLKIVHMLLHLLDLVL